MDVPVGVDTLHQHPVTKTRKVLEYHKADAAFHIKPCFAPLARKYF